jgi:hypothetical protein
MTIKEAWEYMQAHLLNEKASPSEYDNLEHAGKLALAIIRDYMQDVPDTDFSLSDFGRDESYY